MDDVTTKRHESWRQTLQQVREEFAGLSGIERDWIRGRLERLAALQQQMHGLFLAADGAVICADCRGECCARGTYHLTLANLLWWLIEEREVPLPDFSRTCPWLAAEGCLLEVSCRPFNCVTFVCEQIEQRLSAEERTAFYQLEKELRNIYQDFSRRYVGGSLYGLLNIAERLAGEPLLRRP